MPGLDQTGPMGQGSQTGRGMGKCTGNGGGNRRGFGRRGAGRNQEAFDAESNVQFGRGGGRRRRMGGSSL